MDYFDLSVEECRDIENTEEYRAISLALDDFINGECTKEAVILCFLQLFNPSIKSIKTNRKRGRPRIVDPLGKLKAKRPKISLGREIENLTETYRRQNRANPRQLALDHFQDRGGESFLLQCLSLYKEQEVIGGAEEAEKLAFAEMYDLIDIEIEGMRYSFDVNSMAGPIQNKYVNELLDRMESERVHKKSDD